MKNTKKIVLSLMAFSLTGTYVYATDVASGSAAPTGTGVVTAQEAPAQASTLKVDSADFLDEKTMSLKLSQELGGISPDSEVKILEDYGVKQSVKAGDNPKKVTVELSSDLVDELSYSLVSVSEGLDASIDFTLSGDKSKIVNSDFIKEETSIEYITVVDSKTIEVYFNNPLTQSNIEFKIFKELKVDNIFADTTNLNIKMTDALTGNKNYIAIVSLKDSQGKDIEVENSLYDFTTPEFSVPEVATEAAPETLDSTSSETQSGELAVDSGTGTDVATVAMDAKKTPDTGTGTNLLLFITFILSLSILLFTRKQNA